MSVTRWASLEAQLDAAVDRGDLVEARRLDVVVNGARACERCGCTDNFACAGGCSWASMGPPVCTECVNEEGGETDG